MHLKQKTWTIYVYYHVQKLSQEYSGSDGKLVVATGHYFHETLEE